MSQVGAGGRKKWHVTTIWKTLHEFMSQEVLGSSTFSTTSQSVALAKLLHFSTQFIHQLDMNN